MSSSFSGQPDSSIRHGTGLFEQGDPVRAVTVETAGIAFCDDFSEIADGVGESHQCFLMHAE